VNTVVWGHRDGVVLFPSSWPVQKCADWRERHMVKGWWFSLNIEPGYPLSPKDTAYEQIVWAYPFHIKR